MAIVKPQDFIDKYELSVGMYSTNKLTAYITKYTERYLVNLMGAKMFKEFESDLLNDVPRSPNFLEIFNPFNKDCDGLNLGGGYFGYRLNQILESDGIKEMLLGFIYWEYARDLLNQQTPYGGVKQMAENSIVVDTPHSLMWERYNLAVRTYQAIQEFIQINQGQPIGQVVTFVLIPGTNYTDGAYALTGGSGSGASIDATTTAGEITGITFVDAGASYQVGDVLTVDGGDQNATLEVTYVGVGSFENFNGSNKLRAYWL